MVELLERLKPTLPNVYLLSPMPDIYRQTKDEYHLPKGVSNRNKGLEWILKFGVDDAVVYFADDDNTYDLRLFNEVFDKSNFETYRSFNSEFLVPSNLPKSQPNFRQISAL